MFQKPGYHIGDTWYFVNENVVHMFYLTCPTNIPRHSRWSIGHAVSNDLIHWQDQGIILEPGNEGTWDGICPATGSALKYKDQFWMAYTGNYAGPEPTVGFAVSSDLYHWQKIDRNPTLRADGNIYSLAPNMG